MRRRGQCWVAGEPLRRGQWTGAGSRILTLNVRGRGGSGGLLLEIEVGPQTSTPPFPEPESGRGLLPACEDAGILPVALLVGFVVIRQVVTNIHCPLAGEPCGVLPGNPASFTGEPSLGNRRVHGPLIQ